MISLFDEDALKEEGVLRLRRIYPRCPVCNEERPAIWRKNDPRSERKVFPSQGGSMILSHDVQAIKERVSELMGKTDNFPYSSSQGGKTVRTFHLEVGSMIGLLPVRIYGTVDFYAENEPDIEIETITFDEGSRMIPEVLRPETEDPARGRVPAKDAGYFV